MAIRSIIESDLSGKTNAATVTFGLDNTWYEIDLTNDEKKKLEAALKTYLGAGRKVDPKKGQPKPKVVPDISPEKREEIRQWALDNDIEVALYGRIPKKVIAAYEEEFGPVEE